VVKLEHGLQSDELDFAALFIWIQPYLNWEMQAERC